MISRQRMVWARRSAARKSFSVILAEPAPTKVVGVIIIWTSKWNRRDSEWHPCIDWYFHLYKCVPKCRYNESSDEFRTLAKLGSCVEKPRAKSLRVTVRGVLSSIIVTVLFAVCRSLFRSQEICSRDQHKLYVSVWRYVWLIVCAVLKNSAITNCWREKRAVYKQGVVILNELEISIKIKF